MPIGSKAETLQGRSEVVLRTAFAAAPVGLTVVDRSGRIIRMNAALATMLGRNADELEGTSAFDLQLAEDAETGRAMAKDLLAGRIDGYRREARFRRPDGSIGTAIMGVTLLDTEDGPRILTQVVDISDLKRAEDELVRSEARFRAMVQNASDIFTVIDADGTIRWSSPASFRILGLPEGFGIGTSVFDLMHPDDVERMVWEFADHIGRGGYGAPVRFRLRHGDGSWRHMEALGNNLLDDPAVQGIIVNTRDITDRVLAEEAVRDAEQKFRTAFDHAPIGMTMVDTEGRFLDVNRAFCDMVGRTRYQLIGMSASQFTHYEDRGLSQQADELLMSGSVLHHEIEERYVHADGHTVWVMRSVAVVRGQDDQPLYSISQVQDVTERRLAREELAHQALHDPLTGLPNRALFLDRLRVALARAGRRPSSVGVLFLDLDRFKVINDSLGHDAGDQLLVTMAARLQSTLRPMDTAARFGGDEFVILCEDLVAEAEAFSIAERICAAVAEPVFSGDAEVHVTTSIGIALTADPDIRPEDLVRDADAAMYRAKERGKNRYEVFDAHMRDRAVARLAVETALRRAIERDEFVVYYQPAVALDSGRIVGAEALVRWQHPERGLVGPDDFIGLAEETGLIVPIGEWVLRQACTDAAAWRPGQVWVNLASRQLSQPDFVDTVARVLADTGMPPPGLHLEITERVLMEDANATIAVLKKLKGLGVRVGVDDFGTGYSSLARLKQFPIDSVKIDRSFVNGLGHDAEDSAIVTAVISMAHALGLVAMAEGVETDEQLAELRALGCELGQGYLFGRPVPIDEAIAAMTALDSAAS
ncbi:MAG: hypothetical protein JWO37_3545 [Acidimicrobiales bacterium]|nr:hypothetical protein [Acidimicrobiales bacterium]